MWSQFSTLLWSTYIVEERAHVGGDEQHVGEGFHVRLHQSCAGTHVGAPEGAGDLRGFSAARVRRDHQRSELPNMPAIRPGGYSGGADARPGRAHAHRPHKVSAFRTGRIPAPLG